MSGILRNFAVRAAPAVRNNLTQNASIHSGPPRVRISLGEKVVSGVVLGISVSAPSGYILANVKNYRADKE